MARAHGAFSRLVACGYNLVDKVNGIDVHALKP
jgi:hypothetical protein